MQTAHNIITNYIQNFVPNHLLELQSMNIIGKADIATHLMRLFRDFIHSWSHDQLFASNTEVKTWLFTFLKANSAYGILSHHWSPEGELSFQDMQTSSLFYPGLGPTIMDHLQSKLKEEGDLEVWDANRETHPGLVKIINFCQVASQHDCQYVWFDTGCINKTSSAELEESIRSMFNWYKNSKICIVHLAQTTNGADIYKDPWFTRGWTLPELLAPPRIKFYDQSWNSLTSANNDKTRDTELGFPLWEVIEEITSIPQKELLSFKPGIKNVRQRMAWASKRKTTRVEDMAYCLIGIFNIPFSVAYGEGEMAFYRLQLELMQRSDDKALFAWNGPSSVYHSMFAAAPACFSDPLILQATQSDTEYALTNRGLRISLPFFEATLRRGTKANEYVLAAPGLRQTSGITLDVQPNSTRMRVALLGDMQSTASFAILLDYDESTKRYTRVATTTVLKVRRPREIQHEQMFII